MRAPDAKSRIEISHEGWPVQDGGDAPQAFITPCILKPLFQASASGLEGLAALREVCLGRCLAEGGAGLKDACGEGW